MTVEVPFSFIIALSTVNTGAIIAFVGVVVFLALRLGRLPTRQEHNELRAELKEDIAGFRREYKEDMAEFRREYKEDMAEFRREYKEDMAEFRREYKEDLAEFRREHREDMARLSHELREEFRRSHQQIMLALVNHSHREDGQAVFTLPTELETTPSPADN